MEILVKKLVDEDGSEEYVFYESGNFSKPMMILPEGYAEKLYIRLREEMEKPMRRFKRG